MDVLPALGVQKVTQQREKAYVWTDTRTFDVQNYIGKKKSEVKNDQYGFEFLGEGGLCH